VAKVAGGDAGVAGAVAGVSTGAVITGGGDALTDCCGSLCGGDWGCAAVCSCGGVVGGADVFTPSGARGVCAIAGLSAGRSDLVSVATSVSAR